MANVLSSVDERTKLVGHNRLELLLFQLDSKQIFGINVFKVREVLRCPPELKRLPNSNPSVLGVATLRGQTISLIDLQLAIIGKPLEDVDNAAVIVAEYNRTTQGFLVDKVHHIINKNWEDIRLPPIGTGKGHYLTAVTQEEDELIEVIDVERVLYDITGQINESISESDSDISVDGVSDCYVLVVDDSVVARGQIKRSLEKLGVKYVLCKDGRDALDTLHRWADEGAKELANLALVISDVEMPVMDGYTFVANLRSDARLQSLKVLMHTSLSGVFDSSLVEQVQADGFLSKFDAGELVKIVREYVEAFLKKKSI